MTINVNNDYNASDDNNCKHRFKMPLLTIIANIDYHCKYWL